MQALAAVVCALTAYVVIRATGSWDFATLLDSQESLFLQLKDNRDLIFSVSAAAFAAWTFIDQRLARNSDGFKSAYQESYGRRIQALIEELRGRSAKLKRLIKEGNNYEAARKIRTELLHDHSETLMEVHGSYREQRGLNTKCGAIGVAYEHSIQAEDRIATVLSNLAFELDTSDKKRIETAVQHYDQELADILSTMQMHCHKVGKAIPRPLLKRQS